MGTKQLENKQKNIKQDDLTTTETGSSETTEKNPPLKVASGDISTFLCMLQARSSSLLEKGVLFIGVDHVVL